MSRIRILKAICWTMSQSKTSCRHSLTEKVCQQLSQIKGYASSPGVCAAPPRSQVQPLHLNTLSESESSFSSCPQAGAPGPSGLGSRARAVARDSRAPYPGRLDPLPTSVASLTHLWPHCWAAWVNWTATLSRSPYSVAGVPIYISLTLFRFDCA
jgi:hypothetical protein